MTYHLWYQATDCCLPGLKVFEAESRMPDDAMMCVSNKLKLMETTLDKEDTAVMVDAVRNYIDAHGISKLEARTGINSNRIYPVLRGRKTPTYGFLIKLEYAVKFGKLLKEGWRDRYRRPDRYFDKGCVEIVDRADMALGMSELIAKEGLGVIPFATKHGVGYQGITEMTKKTKFSVKMDILEMLLGIGLDVEHDYLSDIKKQREIDNENA